MNPANRLTSNQLLSVLLQSPGATAVYTTENIIIEMANDAILALWGKDRSIIGKPLAEAVPEFATHPFVTILQNVWRTGLSYSAREVATMLKVNRERSFFFDFEFKPILNQDGSTFCILHTASEVSARMAQEEAIAAEHQMLSDINIELAISNRKLTSGNEELQGENASLSEYGRILKNANEKLTITESLFSAISASPDVPLIVMDEEERLLFVNVSFTKLTGLTLQQVTNIGYTSLVHPEDRNKLQRAMSLAAHTQRDYIAQYRLRGRQGEWRDLTVSVAPVFAAGGGFAGFIHLGADRTESLAYEAQLEQLNESLENTNDELRANSEKTQLLNVELQAANEELQATNEELQSINEELITTQQELMLANSLLQESEEKLNLALRSGNLGTWFMNLHTGAFFASARTKELFGFGAEEAMTFEMALEKVDEHYRERVRQGKEKAMEQLGEFHMEFPVTGAPGGGLRWVRSVGKVFATDQQPGATFFGTIDDITERKADEQRKSDFIGMVSHELKTPLASVAGYLHIIEEQMNAAEPGVEGSIAQKAIRQLERMNAMINSYLDMSRSEPGKIALENTLFDMAQLVSEMKDELTSLHTKHKLVFHPVEQAIIQADRNKIAQVIQNLVSNAVKYSAPGTEVHVSCITVDSSAKLSVQDAGIGIPKAELPKLFDRYYRVENPGTQSVAGFGIGLYLCAEIISRQGGKIWAESEPEKGSTFCFTLPLAE